MQNENVLFTTVFGSRLYGTATENSDIDYKTIFIPSVKDLILGKTDILSTSHVKSNKDDNHDKSNQNSVETEYIPVHKFLKMLLEGQTAAIDILFANKESWIFHSHYWNYLYNSKHEFISKNMYAFMGYAKQQAIKYSVKGERLISIKNMLKFLSSLSSDMTLETVEASVNIPEDKYCYVTRGDRICDTFLHVGNKKYMFNAKLDKIIPGITSMINMYGDRAADTEHVGGADFKAISHAFRACREVRELVDTGDLVFPLKDRKFLLDVKLGVYPYKEIVSQLENEITETEDYVKNSSVPDKPIFLTEDYLLYLYDMENE